MLGEAEEQSSDLLHAMPVRWVHVCSVKFTKSHIARLLVHVRSRGTVTVPIIC